MLDAKRRAHGIDTPHATQNDGLRDSARPAELTLKHSHVKRPAPRGHTPPQHVGAPGMQDDAE